MSLNPKLFGPFSAEAMERERVRHGGVAMPERRASHSYCETCQQPKPRRGDRVTKGWRCHDCRPRKRA